MPSDDLWREWHLTQRRCLGLMAKKAYPAAIADIDQFLKSAYPELQSEALAFRGIIKEKMGESHSAKADLLAAHRLSSQATYQRYTIELTLGRLSKLTEDLKDASSWFLRAVDTAIEDPSTSGATAVEGLLDIKEVSSWSSAEKSSCERAIRQAWALFSLPGVPDMDHPKETLQVLAEASTRPLSSTGPGK